MSLLAEVEETNEVESMGSLNHSLLQARLAGVLFNHEKYTPLIELSLDVAKLDLNQFGLKAQNELKPDICLYPKGFLKLKKRDILKVSEIPSLVIEIISPKQGIDDILAKFEAYFQLGIVSCWMVTPTLESITVYSENLENFKTFDFTHGDKEVVDQKLDLRLSMEKIFKDL